MRSIIYITLLLFSVQAYGQKTPVKHYDSFNDFYDQIANKKYLNFSSITLTDTITSFKQISSDSIQEIFSIKLNEWTIKYVVTRNPDNKFSYNNPSFILFNNQKILPDSNSSFEGLSITAAGIANLNGTTYLVLSSWSPGCNGTFCTIEYYQVFEIKNKKVEYQIVTGWQQPLNIFCDLNNDGQLDLISFVGKCSSKNDSTETSNSGKYFFCAQVLTFKNNNWIPLTDKHKKQYFIFFETDDFFELDTFKVIDYNWTTEL